MTHTTYTSTQTGSLETIAAYLTNAPAQRKHALPKSLAVLADLKAQDEVVENVRQYLHRAVEAAKQMLPRDTANLGDSFTGEDDSDGSE